MEVKASNNPKVSDHRIFYEDVILFVSSLGDGTEMLRPMAIVVIGGLLFGLLLVFLFR